MPTRVHIAVSAERTDELLVLLRNHPGLLSLQVQRGASILPSGDVLSFSILNQHKSALMRALQDFPLAQDLGSSLQTSEVSSLVVPAHNDSIAADISESSWEEMEMMIANESNMSINALLVMGTAGLIAAIGILTGSLHVVIGAMLIAPGFEPLVRIVLHLVSRGSQWKRGLIDSMKGYVTLFVGALLGAIVVDVLPSSSSTPYLEPALLVAYWSSMTLPSVLVSFFSGAAGALLVVSNRSVLTGGVMIALALIPAPTLMAIALFDGDMALLGKASLRFAVEVCAVLASSLVVFIWKSHSSQKRTTLQNRN